MDKISPRQIVVLCLSMLVLLIGICSIGSILENLDAGQVMVIQAPFSGELTWYTQPGTKWQWWGKVTKYNKRTQFWFSKNKDEGKADDESIRIQFNDGGHAQISGGISWEIPLDVESLTSLHTKYGSQEAIEKQLIKTVISKAVYMTGPTMSSTESYAGRRNELLHLIEEQVQDGVYLTKTINEKVKDAVTGIEKTVSKVELTVDKDGKPIRAEESPLNGYKIKVNNLSIDHIKYDERVETQIQEQQQATMKVQTSQAKAKEAEQKVLTVKKEGEATAAEAEWIQKAIAAKEVAKADQEKTVAETRAAQEKNVAETKAAQLLAVAELDAKAAEQFKTAETLRGQGEAARRKLVMEADGALEKRLEAYVSVEKVYAETLRGATLVPSIVMGSGAPSGGTDSALGLIDLLKAKAAKDLSVELSPKK